MWQRRDTTAEVSGLRLCPRRLRAVAPDSRAAQVNINTRRGGDKHLGSEAQCVHHILQGVVNRMPLNIINSIASTLPGIQTARFKINDSRIIYK